MNGIYVFSIYGAVVCADPFFIFQLLERENECVCVYIA